MKTSWLTAGVDLSVTVKSYYLELQKCKTYILLRGKYLKMQICTSSVANFLGGYREKQQQQQNQNKTK